MEAEDYELFVQKVYQDLLKYDHVVVYHQKEYVRRSSGLPIKIDVSFEVEVAGARILVLVECKHYARRVEVGDIDEFFARLQDIGAHKGVILITRDYRLLLHIAHKQRKSLSAGDMKNVCWLLESHSSPMPDSHRRR